MCGDCNAEQFRDLKTPQGKVLTDSDNLMYGRMWMVTMDTCKGMYTNNISQSLCVLGAARSKPLR